MCGVRPNASRIGVPAKHKWFGTMNIAHVAPLDEARFARATLGSDSESTDHAAQAYNYSCNYCDSPVTQ